MSTIITLIGILVVFIISSSINKLFDSNYTERDNDNYKKIEDDIIIEKNDDKFFDEECVVQNKEVLENFSEECFNELMMTQLVVSKILEENVFYIQRSYYDLSVEGNDKEILDTENVFEDVSPQLLCLKLIHNISMMKSFAMNYAMNSEASINNSNSKQKKLFLKLLISAERIDIIEKKGFGLIGYNVDDMAYALYSYYYAMKDYIEDLSVKPKYKFLKRVLREFETSTLSFSDPNQAMMSFLNNNKDFYEKQIDEVKSLLNKKRY